MAYFNGNTVLICSYLDCTSALMHIIDNTQMHHIEAFTGKLCIQNRSHYQVQCKMYNVSHSESSRLKSITYQFLIMYACWHSIKAVVMWYEQCSVYPKNNNLNEIELGNLQYPLTISHAQIIFFTNLSCVENSIKRVNWKQSSKRFHVD